jgi:subtilisin family serine protease
MSKDCALGIEQLENKKVLSSTSSSQPIVAIVDSGIDLYHIDLKDNIFINTKEIAGDNIDNDNNGYIDDISGWNFVSNNNIPQDDFYHGTHVAGIVTGVSNDISIMPLKFQNSSGLGYTGAAASAINYATNMKLKGINIASINLSWGGGTSSSLILESAIKRANDLGIVVVTAAGNNSSNNDLVPRYPSSYKLSNTISVAATNRDLTLANYSNYGKNSVDIAAPGTGIYSTLPNNSYGYVSGTSMAAPFVSGAVALLKSININYVASQIKSAILSAASYVENLADKVGYGFLNVGGAITLLKNMVPLGESYQPPVQIVVQPKIVYGLYKVSKSIISGWAYDSSNMSNKLKVQVSINNTTRYVVVANSGNGSQFTLNLSKKYFSKKWNLVVVKILDAVNQKEAIAYSGYIRR